MTAAILVLNAGSSSIKFSLYQASESPRDGLCLYRGELEGLGHKIHFEAQDVAGALVVDSLIEGPASHQQALSVLLEWLKQQSNAIDLVAAGHRVVHGGNKFFAPVVVTAKIIQDLKELTPLAPQHQPHNLAAIAGLSELHPRLSQVACFDTSFHQTQSEVATTFALPRVLTAGGIKRYGFHGLSYEYIASVLPLHLGAKADGRVVVAHLGNGASMCAMANRQSVATTMGFSALDGLVMGRRCGTLDPGVILYLLDARAMTARAISNLLYEESGLLGVSGISDDMRDLLASSDPRAAEAVALFVYRISRELGSLVAALGGLDALVFTGGIGEHAAEIRRRVCENARWLGIALDGEANQAGGPCITQNDSHPSAWIIPTNEDLMIARHTSRLLT
jgi:acetate kinase